MRAGVALHYLDPLVTDRLGPYPCGKSFAIGHECVAEVEVRGLGVVEALHAQE